MKLFVDVVPVEKKEEENLLVEEKEEEIVVDASWNLHRWSSSTTS